MERPRQLYRGINPTAEVFFRGMAVVMEYRFTRGRGKDKVNKLSNIEMSRPDEPTKRSHNGSRPVRILFTREDISRYNKLKAELEGLK